MMLEFYRIVTWLALKIARCLGPWFPTIANFIDDREQALLRWQARTDLTGCWLFHVSSVGELEQVRPVIEALQGKFPWPIVISYFSSSVPRLMKDWSFVTYADFMTCGLRC
jgi:3-deoxy-D-manno-octulosonic-acid transferase